MHTPSPSRKNIQAADNKTPMRIFIDTEFTHFIHCDLISIGLVADDNRQFYGERSDFDKRLCSDFVKQHVLPQLGKASGCVYTRSALRSAMLYWLYQFENYAVEICYDYEGDWHLFRELLDGQIPTWVRGRNIRGAIDQNILRAYLNTMYGGVAHHALHDALCNQAACKESKNDLQGGLFDA